jgi:hypothetical protein
MGVRPAFNLNPCYPLFVCVAFWEWIVRGYPSFVKLSPVNLFLFIGTAMFFVSYLVFRIVGSMFYFAQYKFAQYKKRQKPGFKGA